MMSRVPRRIAWATNYFQVAVTLAQLLIKAFVTIATLCAELDEKKRALEWQRQHNRELQSFNDWLVTRGFKFKDFTQRNYVDHGAMLEVEFQASSLMGEEVCRRIRHRVNELQRHRVAARIDFCTIALRDEVCESIARGMAPWVLAAVLEAGGDKSGAEQIRQRIDENGRRHARR